jgi:hypothetical protein
VGKDLFCIWAEVRLSQFQNTLYFQILYILHFYDKLSFESITEYEKEKNLKKALKMTVDVVKEGNESCSAKKKQNNSMYIIIVVHKHNKACSSKINKIV